MRPLARRLPRVHWRLVVPIIAGVLLAVGLAALACLAVALADGDEAGELGFAVTAAVALPAAALGLRSRDWLATMPLRPRDGFLAVTGAWVVAAAVGAVPFLVEGTFDRPVDAFFESMSGYTTTGATLIDEIESEPDAILLWRSVSQWLGGVGIVVLVVAVAPAAGAATQRIFFAETSGVTSERLTPRIADTAKVIWGVYVALTTAGVVAFALAGMPAFDAVNHSFTSVATGGFSTRTASIAAFESVAVELVAIVLMVLGGVNFALYWVLVRRRGSVWPQLAEVRAYLLILLVASIAVATSLVVSDDARDAGEAARAGAFTVVSLMTSTGYTTADFDTWNDFARFVVLAVMFVGGCAGSTAGGMKVIRILLLGRTAAQELERQLRPKAVQVLRIGGRVFPEEVRRAVLGFLVLYVAVLGAAMLVLAGLGLDFVTAASAAIATLNIVGPALGEVGGAENFGAMPQGALWFLSALMLVGRLEVLTVLVLLTRAFWRPNVA